MSISLRRSSAHIPMVRAREAPGYNAPSDWYTAHEKGRLVDPSPRALRKHILIVQPLRANGMHTNRSVPSFSSFDFPPSPF